MVRLPGFLGLFRQGRSRRDCPQVGFAHGATTGEVGHIRFEHIVDGWWEMPGQPVGECGWSLRSLRISAAREAFLVKSRFACRL